MFSNANFLDVLRPLENVLVICIFAYSAWSLSIVNFNLWVLSVDCHGTTQTTHYRRTTLIRAHHAKEKIALCFYTLTQAVSSWTFPSSQMTAFV